MSKKRIVIIASIGMLILLITSVLIVTSRQSAESPDRLVSLGEKYLTELNYEQALVQFLKVIEIDPMNPRGYTGAAEAYIGLGRTDDAVAILQQGLERTGDDGIRSMIGGLLSVEEQEQNDIVENDLINEDETDISNLTGKDPFTFADIYEWGIPFGATIYEIQEHFNISDSDLMWDMEGNPGFWGDVQINTSSQDGIISAIALTKESDREGPRGIKTGMPISEIISMFRCDNNHIMEVVNDALPATEEFWEELYVDGDQLSQSYIDSNALVYFAWDNNGREITLEIHYVENIVDMIFIWFRDISMQGVENQAGEVSSEEETLNTAQPTEVPLTEATETTSDEMQLEQTPLPSPILPSEQTSSSPIPISPTEQTAQPQSEISVNFKDYGLTDLSEVDIPQNVTHLYLEFNQISDLSLLSDLTELRVLGLTSNQVTDLTPLGSLTKLTDLTIDQNGIMDLTPLSRLSNLTYLSVSDNEISDLTPLAGLTRLRELHVWGNRISDLKPLTNLAQLTVLELSENQINDISPLQNLTKLTELNLSENSITDWSSVAHVVSVRGRPE